MSFLAATDDGDVEIASSLVPVAESAAVPLAKAFLPGEIDFVVEVALGLEEDSEGLPLPVLEEERPGIACLQDPGFERVAVPVPSLAPRAEEGTPCLPRSLLLRLLLLMVATREPTDPDDGACVGVNDEREEEEEADADLVPAFLTAFARDESTAAAAASPAVVAAAVDAVTLAAARARIRLGESLVSSRVSGGALLEFDASESDEKLRFESARRGADCRPDDDASFDATAAAVVAAVLAAKDPDLDFDGGATGEVDLLLLLELDFLSVQRSDLPVRIGEISSSSSSNLLGPTKNKEQRHHPTRDREISEAYRI